MGSLGSSNNAILVSKCQNLQNLTVSLQVTQDLITFGNNGFSLQLNCYPQTNPQSIYQGQPLKWFQYVIAVENNSVEWGIQYWSAVKGFGFSPSPNYVSFGSASSNQVPAGSVMKIVLGTQPNGTVTSAAFSVTDPSGNVSSFTFPFPSNVLFAIYGFQVDLVGPPSGTHTCLFTSGAGVLTYSVSSGTLAVQNTNTCGGPQPGTGETSNALYRNVIPASGPTVSQNLYVPDWTWEAQGALPGAAGTKASHSPGVVYQPPLDRIQVFVVGSDGNLYDKYYNGTQWVWEAQGAPPGAAGTKAIESPGVVYQPPLDRIAVFVVGSDGNLYDKYYNGTQWVWEAQGAPPGAAGTKAINSPGVVFQPTLNRVQVFVVGSDGKLYDKYYNGTQWVWEAQGAPPGAAGTQAIDSPGVVYQPPLDRIAVFVVGSDGNLYDKYYDGTQWVWEAQGAPPGAAGTKAINSPGVVFQPTLNRIQVFVVGSDGKLYDKYYDGTQWVWEAQGAPAPPGAAGANAINSPGVVFQPSLDRIAVFVVGSDGNLYDKYYSG